MRVLYGTSLGMNHKDGTKIEFSSYKKAIEAINIEKMNVGFINYVVNQPIGITTMEYKNTGSSLTLLCPFVGRLLFKEIYERTAVFAISEGYVPIMSPTLGLPTRLVGGVVQRRIGIAKDYNGTSLSDGYSASLNGERFYVPLNLELDDTFPTTNVFRGLFTLEDYVYHIGIIEGNQILRSIRYSSLTFEPIGLNPRSREFISGLPMTCIFI